MVSYFIFFLTHVEAWLFAYGGCGGGMALTRARAGWAHGDGGGRADGDARNGGRAAGAARPRRGGRKARALPAGRTTRARPGWTHDDGDGGPDGDARSGHVIPPPPPRMQCAMPQHVLKKNKI